MNKGKQVGEFSLKCTTITVSPGPGGSTVRACNFEGNVSGVGTVVLTVSFVGGRSGTYSLDGFVFRDDGENFSATGYGEAEAIGINRWRTTGILHRSTGETRIAEGEVDLATRSWTGKQYESA